MGECRRSGGGGAVDGADGGSADDGAADDDAKDDASGGVGIGDAAKDGLSMGTSGGGSALRVTTEPGAAAMAMPPVTSSGMEGSALTTTRAGDGALDAAEVAVSAPGAMVSVAAGLADGGMAAGDAATVPAGGVSSATTGGGLALDAAAADTSRLAALSSAVATGCTACGADAAARSPVTGAIVMLGTGAVVGGAAETPMVPDGAERSMAEMLAVITALPAVAISPLGALMAIEAGWRDGGTIVAPLAASDPCGSARATEVVP